MTALLLIWKYKWWVLGLALLAIIGLQEARYRAYRASVIAATAKAQVAAEKAKVKAAEAQSAYYAKVAEAESNYAAGRESAIHANEVLLYDLRADRIRLRSLWAGCQVRSAQETGAPPQGTDGQADDRIESAGRIVSAATDADLWITRLQAHLTAARTLAESCNR